MIDNENDILNQTGKPNQTQVGESYSLGKTVRIVRFVNSIGILCVVLEFLWMIKNGQGEMGESLQFAFLFVMIFAYILINNFIGFNSIIGKISICLSVILTITLLVYMLIVYGIIFSSIA